MSVHATRKDNSASVLEARSWTPTTFSFASYSAGLSKGFRSFHCARLASAEGKAFFNLQEVERLQTGMDYPSKARHRDQPLTASEYGLHQLGIDSGVIKSQGNNLQRGGPLSG